MKIQDLKEGCAHGEYYCSTDKKWKCRQGPKQTRATEAANPAQLDEAINWKGAAIGGLTGAGLGALAGGPIGASIGGWAGASIGSGVGQKPSNSQVKKVSSRRSTTLMALNDIESLAPDILHDYINDPIPGIDPYQEASDELIEIGYSPVLVKKVISDLRNKEGVAEGWFDRFKDKTEPVEATPEMKQQALKIIEKLKKVVPASYHSLQMFDERLKLAVSLSRLFQPLGKGFYKTDLGKAIGRGTHEVVDDGLMSDPDERKDDLKRVMSAIDSMEYFLNNTQDVAEEKQRLDPSCWDGYKKDGTKMKGDTRVNNCVKEELEETYDGDEFFEAYGELWYNEDEQLDEAEYQGRSVPLGKPMQGDVKKFKVYVKDPSTGNVKKVNFGDPDMKIRKSNPAARRSFRARHNCDNPGPRTKARYWSCRKW